MILRFSNFVAMLTEYISLAMKQATYKGKIGKKKESPQKLSREGVPKEDIVLAFHHPETRKYTDFAVT